MENLGKRTETTDTNRNYITNRIKETEERISSVEGMTEEILMSVKENAKAKTFLIQNIQKIEML
jgi:hypothetical protein